MAGFYLVRPLKLIAVAILFATVCGAHRALGQYTFVQDTDNSGMWADPAMWTGGSRRNVSQCGWRNRSHQCADANRRQRKLQFDDASQRRDRRRTHDR